jgi:pyruvate kinase
MHHPRTKIVCTLGPASSSREAIGTLMDTGLDVARINFSHGTHAQHEATIALVRELAAERKRPVAILCDLQGPRIRIGELPAPVQLEVVRGTAA